MNMTSPAARAAFAVFQQPRVPHGTPDWLLELYERVRQQIVIAEQQALEMDRNSPTMLDHRRMDTTKGS